MLLLQQARNHCFLDVGVEFYQEINGQMERLIHYLLLKLMLVRVIHLTRTYFPDGKNRKLECEGKFICYTIELP